MLLDAAYALALGIASPALLLRAARTGRYRQHLQSKLLGAKKIANPERRPVAWFHGVSVGEIHLLSTLVPAFEQRFPGWLPVVSSTTDTGLKEAQSRFKNLNIIPWPLDFSWAVEASLAAVKPCLVVLAESELWPNFLAAASRKNVPVAVVNARLSPRSAARYRRTRHIADRLLFRHVSRILCQSADYAERFRSFGIADAKLRTTGSIKYDGATGERNTPKAAALREWLGEPLGPVLVAGSTHAPEEELILKAYCELKPRHPELKLILVPRHPDRFEAVAQIIINHNIHFQRRSRPGGGGDVYLLDTVGELGAAWANATLGYVGGSLDGVRGGQSMIEPAGFGVPAVFGPHVWNFRDAARRLVESDAAVQIPNASELTPALDRLLSNRPLSEQIGERARLLVRQQQGATQRTLDALSELMESQ
jgi:3-deoxy-D-manno-octulosonic-acid transferase